MKNKTLINLLFGIRLGFAVALAIPAIILAYWFTIPWISFIWVIIVWGVAMLTWKIEDTIKEKKT